VNLYLGRRKWPGIWLCAVVSASALTATLVAISAPSSETLAAGPEVATTKAAPPTITPTPPPPTSTPEVYRSFAVALVREDQAWQTDDAGHQFAVIGHSVQGRPLVAHRVGAGPRTIVLIGGLHQGAEEATSKAVQGLFTAIAATPELVPGGLTIVAITVANPDGLELGTRLNARSVDLNRNWPTDDWTTPAVHGDTTVSAGDAPLSEPETSALFSYFQSTKPALVASWHGYASIVEGNDIAFAETLAGVFAEAAGYDLLEKWPYYPITGELIVALADLGIPAFDVELDRWTTVETDIERNLEGLIAIFARISDTGFGEIPSAAPVPEVAP